MHQWAKTKQFPKSPDHLIGEYRVKQDSPEKMLATLKEFANLREESNAQPKSPKVRAKKKSEKPKKKA